MLADDSNDQQCQKPSIVSDCVLVLQMNPASAAAVQYSWYHLACAAGTKLSMHPIGHHTSSYNLSARRLARTLLEAMYTTTQ